MPEGGGAVADAPGEVREAQRSPRWLISDGSQASCDLGLGLGSLKGAHERANVTRSAADPHTRGRRGGGAGEHARPQPEPRILRAFSLVYSPAGDHGVGLRALAAGAHPRRRARRRPVQRCPSCAFSAIATAVQRRAPAMSERIVTAPSVERCARLLHGDALRVVRSIVGRDYELSAQDILDIAWTVALWVSVDITARGAILVPAVTALHRQALALRARIELRDFRCFRVPRVRLASSAGSTRVRVAIAKCDVDTLADPRVPSKAGLSELVAQLEVGLNEIDRSVLPHNRSSDAALTPAARKRFERVKRRLRDQASRNPRLRSDVADYFDRL